MNAALPVPFLLFFAGAFGSIIGSFLNVCIYRLPRGLSIVTPRSSCPSCGEMIPGYRNVPVLSWFLLAGRGACCGERISARYPFVEALMAGAAVLTVYQHGLGVEAVSQFLFLSALVVLYFTDLDLRLLPDAVTLTMTVVGLVLAYFRPSIGLLPAFLAAIGGFGLFLGVAMLWRWYRGIEAVGGGDIKMMAMLGAFLGPVGLLVALLLASASGAIIGSGIALAYAVSRLDAVSKRRPKVSRTGLLGALFSRGLRRKTVPFGCFLSLGAAAALFFGDAIATWYLGLLKF